jgi:glyoxylase-like metal-dependent hydrolase (beta-lactamase superfamily II)
LTVEKRVYRLEPDISLIDVAPPMPGFGKFLGAYVIQAPKIAVIDPGPASSLPNLLTGLAELRIDPRNIDYILATHIHLDHTGGLGSLIKLTPRANIVVHEKGRAHLINPTRLWEGSLQVLGQMAKDYGEPEPVPEDRIITAVEGMEIDLGSLRLEVLTTPGHATHHLSFFGRQKGLLFAGESAGLVFPEMKVCLPSTPTPFDLKEAFESADKMLALQPLIIYYAHFGGFPMAVERLQEYRQNLLICGRIIASHPAGKRPDILDEILETLRVKEQFYQTSTDRLKMKLDFTRANIQGYLDYFQRKGFNLPL